MKKTKMPTAAITLGGSEPVAFTLALDGCIAAFARIAEPAIALAAASAQLPKNMERKENGISS